MNITTLWDKCLKDISDRLSEKQMKTWLHPLEVKLEQNILSIVAPNKFIKDAVETDYLKIIKETVYNQSEETVNIINLSLQESEIKKEACVQERKTKDIISNLNKELVFSNFVEGKSNQLAKAACVSVVSKLGQYNPLYIYGGVGLGKTHLLHSIGNEILANDKNKRVVYLHSEKFVQNMVTALRQNKIEQFKAFYRSVDALLLDDIQFFANKERSQEEFFHTFNTLFEYKKQVVLTSDKYPKEIDGLEERLKSRLGWGLPVVIDPPELETRAAVLLNKASSMGVILPNDCAIYIAQRIRSNIRELEGALKRVVANARFTSQNIDLALVKDALKDLFVISAKMVSIENIQKTVAEYYNIRLSDLLSKRRSRSITRPRQMAMALTKELTNHSLPEIGEAFNGRDHTTVLHACKKILELRKESSSHEEDYRNLNRALTN